MCNYITFKLNKYKLKICLRSIFNTSYYVVMTHTRYVPKSKIQIYFKNKYICKKKNYLNIYRRLVNK